jgi:hypothetical protein
MAVNERNKQIKPGGFENQLGNTNPENLKPIPSGSNNSIQDFLLLLQPRRG